MDRFYKSDAVAFQWLQHRDGERARLEAELSRLQAAADSCSKMDVNPEMDVQMRHLNQEFESIQVLHICIDKCK